MCHTFIIPIYAWPSYIVYTHTVQSVCMYYICIYHVFSVTVSHILYLHYLDFPEISEITSCFTFWVSSCDVAIIQANIWIWYKYITYTKSYHVCINIKCMYPQYPSIFSNLYSTLILCEYLWLGWINSSYIYILLPNPWQPLFYFSCFFPRKLTRLGNPCWLKGIPTLVSNLIFFSHLDFEFFPERSQVTFGWIHKQSLGFFWTKNRHLADPPPSEWNEGINKLIYSQPSMDWRNLFHFVIIWSYTDGWKKSGQPVEVGSLSHLQGSIHHRWSRISSINSIIIDDYRLVFFHQNKIITLLGTNPVPP